MAEAETAPRKRLVIKLYLPRSLRREEPPSEASDPRGHKRKSNQRNGTDEHSDAGKSNAIAKASRTTTRWSSSEECRAMAKDDDADSRGGKKRKVTITATTTTRVSATATRFSRSTEEKEENIAKVCSNKRIDRLKKMQCWAILKRFMIGRDGWAFKQPLDLKDLDGRDEGSGEALRKKKPMIGLEDVECKLNKLAYPGPEEFADDVRLVFSYELLYPPGSEIHKIARRLGESFEQSWKSLKDKWSSEERKEKKKMMGMLQEEEEKKKKIRKGNNKGNGGDFFCRDSSQICDAEIALPGQKRSGTRYSLVPQF